MHLGDAWIMLRSARTGSATPARLGHGTQSLTVFVNDVDAHFERARAAGARIEEISTRRCMANGSTGSRISTAITGSSRSMLGT
jgi:uncharacterized glyoxalase superfamily protein PhnB